MLNRLGRCWLEWRITADEASTRCVRAACASASPMTPSQPLVLSGLEPRILFSATPIDMAALTAGDDGGAMVATVECQDATQRSFQAEVTTCTLAEQSSGEIIIIDASVPDLQQFLDDLSASGRDAEVFVLDAERDGIDQITEILGDRSDLDSIHLVTHAEDGAIKLGNLWLGEANLDGYAGQLASWQASLSTDADILLYGCDLAADASGQALVESISELTGADVAASTDDTGHAKYGGDWDLEYSTGEIESDVVFSNQLQQDWQHKLATITVTTFADVVDGGDGVTSLREAVIAANAGGGGDTIVLSSGTYLLTIAGSGEDAAATGDLDLTQDVTLTGAGATTIIDASGMGDRVFDAWSGTVSLTDLKITGGSSTTGGAINTQGIVTLNLTDVEVYNNDASSNGGGIFNRGTLNLDRVTIAGNTSASNGGGIFFSTGSDGTLTNVTISGNDAIQGGGLHNGNASVLIVNSTIAANSTGISESGSATTQLKNTILDNIGLNSDETLISLGNNIDSDGSAGLGDALDGVDPLLGALADNGGVVRTHAITAASPAYNAGTLAGAPGIDARGRGRDGSPDIGAFEVTPSTSIGPITDGDAKVNSVAENAIIGATVGITATATDPDAGDTVTYTLDNDAGGLFDIDLNSGIVTVAAALDYESATSHSVTVRATSSDGSFSTITLTIDVTDVNDVVPVVDVGQSFGVSEATGNTTSLGLVTATDPDTVGSFQNWSITGGNTDGIFAINAATGELTVVDNSNLNFEITSTYVLSITVSDGVNTSSAESVTINIINANEPPTDINLDNANVDENSAGAVIGNVGVVDPDAGDTHAWTVDDVRFEIVGGQLRLKAGQSLDFETEPTVNLTITATDQGGGGLAYNEAFVITVNNVNDAPIAVDDDHFGANQGATYNRGAPGVLINDSDGDGDTLTAQLVGGPAFATTFTLNPDGSYTYRHDGSATTTDTFTYRAWDGTSFSNVATVTIHINPVNQAPTDVTLSNNNVNENTAGAAIGNIGIVDPDVFDFHTATVDDSRFEIFGSLLRLRAGQSLDFESTPTVDVTITVRDQGGTGLSYSEVFTITVNNLNDAPIADTEGYFVIEGNTVITAAPGVLLGDLDPDGDAITAVLVSGPSFGTLVFAADGSFTYTPDAGFTGIDAFVYTASDGALSSTPTLVTISVTPGVAPLPPTPGDGDGDDDEPVPPLPPVGDPDPPADPETPVVNDGGPILPGDNTPNGAPTPRERLAPALPSEPTEAEVFIADRGVDTGFGASFSATLGSSIERNGESLSADEIRSRLQAIFQVSVFDSQWQSLDTLREELLSDGKYESLVVGAAVGAAVAMSIGQAVWLLRAGYMASTLMSTMPIWRSIDPLPVLEYLEGDSNQPTDTESLQSIIEQGNGKQPVKK